LQMSGAATWVPDRMLVAGATPLICTDRSATREVWVDDDLKPDDADQADLLHAIKRPMSQLVGAERGIEPSLGDPVRITAELIESGKSPRGGWSKAQMAILGVGWPPAPGWKTRVIGRLITRADAERFFQLRSGGIQ